MTTTVPALRKVATTATANATLTKGKHTPVDATSGPLTMTLPTGAAEGVELTVEKTDASANTVTVSGTIRGSASTLILTSQYQTVTFRADAAGSWRVASDHRTATAMTATLTARGFAGRTVILAGDSITAAGDDFASADKVVGDSIGGWAERASGGRLYYLNNAGVSGDTSTQLLARFDPIVAQAPSVIVIQIGTNDARGNVPVATYAGNIRALVAKCRAAGILPVLRLVPPIGAATVGPPAYTAAVVKTAASRYNTWLRMYASTERIALDSSSYDSVVDVTNGNIGAAYNFGDQVHLLSLGNQVVGQGLWASLAPIFAGIIPDLVRDAGDPNDLLTGKGLFLANTSGVGNGWSAGGGGVGSIVTDAAVPGSMQRVTAPGTNGFQAYVYTTVTAFAPGDVLEVSGVVTSPKVASHTAAVNIVFKNASDVSVGSSRALSTSEAATRASFIRRVTVPAGATYAQLYLFVGQGAAAADFGQIRVRNLTAMGVLTA